MAAADLATELFDRPRTEPLLLIQPGLLARYRLSGFLTRMVEAAKDPETPAILVLVPGHDHGGIRVSA